MAHQPAARALPASTSKQARKQPKGLSSAKGKANPRDAAWLERQLNRITAKALDDLKNPTAIPSRVILQALVEARKV